MARSTYIYYAQPKTKRDDPAYAAAFTVKHELVSWLRGNQDDYFIWRFRDGAFPGTQVITLPRVTDKPA